MQEGGSDLTRGSADVPSTGKRSAQLPCSYSSREQRTRDKEAVRRSLTARENAGAPEAQAACFCVASVAGSSASLRGWAKEATGWSFSFC